MINKESTEKVYGIVQRRGAHSYLIPAEKNRRDDYLLTYTAKAKNGDYVSAEAQGFGRNAQAKVRKNFGPFNLNKATATLILDKYDILTEWNAKIEKELNFLPQFDLSARVDLTKVPLVTIDGDDAKDFDDAIWAEETAVGFNLIVAIADVAFYVRPDTALDKEAFARGNSVYLPNMVVPMLPEKLSNELCSLQPKQMRASIVCFLSIDKQGQIISYDFARAVIQSAARLTYAQVQKNLDGDKTPFVNKIVEPLYAAYLALAQERKRRGALELETTEIKVKVNKQGLVTSVTQAEHFESCKIVEEFMIAANNAAALALEKSKLPTMYRVHDKAKKERMEELKPLLADLGLKLPEMPALKPEHFNKLIELCQKEGYSAGISELVLRMQAQAQYSPKNIGHFGLGLKDYVHFTSPIRRYADLLVHRALIKAYGWAEGGGLPDGATVQQFEKIGEHLGDCERRAVSAERDLTARFVSAYLEPAIGQEFEVQISGMSSAGLFVRLDSIGAEGLIPMGTLPDDNYALTNGNMLLEGSFSGLTFAFGEKLKVRLMEASAISGGLIFKYIDAENGENYYQKGRPKPRFDRVKKAKTKPKSALKKESKKGAKKCRKK